MERDVNNIDFFKKTALDLWSEECRNRPIITGSRQLDLALAAGNVGGDGGVPIQRITEIYGPPGSGKTQLCMQLCVNVQLPFEMGGACGMAFYVDTKCGVSPHRLRELSDAAAIRVNAFRAKHPFDDATAPRWTANLVMDRIQCAQVRTSTELLAAVTQIFDMVELSKYETCKLIVIDSLSTIFKRDESQAAALTTSTDRMRVLAELVDVLDAIATRHKCAIVLANDLTTMLQASAFLSTPQSPISPTAAAAAAAQSGNGAAAPEDNVAEGGSPAAQPVISPSSRSRKRRSDCGDWPEGAVSWLVPALGPSHAHRVAQVMQLDSASRRRYVSSRHDPDTSSVRNTDPQLFLARVTKALNGYLGNSRMATVEFKITRDGVRDL